MSDAKFPNSELLNPDTRGRIIGTMKTYKNAEEIIDGFLKAVVSLSQDVKKMVCEIDKGPADIPPVLMWVTSQNKLETEQLFICDEKIAPTAVKEALAKMFVEHGEPRVAAIVVEAYAKRNGSPEEAENWQRGQLQREFEKGNVDGIDETISAYLFDTSGNRRTACLFYKYDDSGKPVFDEIQTETKPSVGAIADVVDDFLAFIR